MIPENIIPGLFEGSNPFCFKSEKQSNSIVICIHGFGASPYEVRPVAQKIFENGIDAVGPLLPGHGIESKKDAKKAMNKSTLEDWLTTVRVVIEKARDHYENVYMYGQSMGGAINLLMASKGLIDACALTAPGLKLPRGAGIFHLLGRINFNVPHIERGDYYNETYLFRNSRAIRHLLRLTIQTQKNLSKITCPVLVCHSHNDKTINPKVVTMIQNKVKGPVQVRWFDKSGHTLPLDKQKEEVAEEIAQFFLQLNKKN